MTSKNIFHCAALGCTILILCAAHSLAEVEVQMNINPTRALLHESVVANLTVANNSSLPIRLGGPNANADIDFDLSEMNGRTVRERQNRSLPETPLLIEPFTTVSFEIDLVSSHMLVKALPYKVVCRIITEEGSFVSNQAYFDVLPGTAIVSRTIRRGDVARRYLLAYLYRDNHAQLFLRVENHDGSICHGVYNFGNYIRIQEARLEFDYSGRVHLLFQSGPRRFSHYILTEHGQTEQKKFYSGIANRIGLSRSSEGEVSVVGGEPYAGDMYSPTFDFRTNRIFE